MSREIFNYFGVFHDYQGLILVWHNALFERRAGWRGGCASRRAARRWCGWCSGLKANHLEALQRVLRARRRFDGARHKVEPSSAPRGLVGPANPLGYFRLESRLSVQRVALAATAPAAAPLANHIAARRMRCRTVPPFAAVTAASRSLLSAAVLVFSSVRALWAAASFACQALQSRAKS